MLPVPYTSLPTLNIPTHFQEVCKPSTLILHSKCYLCNSRKQILLSTLKTDSGIYFSSSPSLKSRIARISVHIIGKVLLISHFAVILSSWCYTNLLDWITIHIARKTTKTPSILLEKNTEEYQVPKSIHITHYETEHSYVENLELPPVLLSSKKILNTGK